MNIFRDPTKKVVYTLMPQLQADGSVSVIVRVGVVNGEVFEEVASNSYYIQQADTAPLHAPLTDEEKTKTPFEILEHRVEVLLRQRGQLRL